MDNVPCGVSANNVALYQWSTAIKNMGLILQEINFQHSPSTLLWLHLLYFIRLYHYSYSASILDISTNLFKRPCWVVIHQRHDLGYYLLSKFFLLLPIRTWCSHILATPRLSNLPLPPRRSKFWFKPVFLCMFSLCFICSQSCALSICMYNPKSNVDAEQYQSRACQAYWGLVSDTDLCPTRFRDHMHFSMFYYQVTNIQA